MRTGVFVADLYVEPVVGEPSADPVIGVVDPVIGIVDPATGRLEPDAPTDDDAPRRPVD